MRPTSMTILIKATVKSEGKRFNYMPICRLLVSMGPGCDANEGTSNPTLKHLFQYKYYSQTHLLKSLQNDIKSIDLRYLC